MGEKVLAHFQGPAQGGPAGKRVAVWGLAFKPGTDDLREAPALTLIDQLLAAGCEVVATDPQAMPAARKLLGEKLRMETSNYKAAEGADALVLMTEWREYRRPNFERLKQLLRKPVLFDGRNQWEPGPLRAAGFQYTGIGRGATNGD
jgi:UDPglucose 6-dehydrogenase